MEKFPKIKLGTINKYNQKGFWLYLFSNNALSFHWWEQWNVKKSKNIFGGFLMEFSPFRPAGLRLVGPFKGFTFYFGWRARGGIPGKPHGPWPKFRIGLTTYANKIPYSFA